MATKETKIFSDLDEIADDFRLSQKKYKLVFAHNGVGKTRLSMIFKDKGKHEGLGDTLYFNAFTEDLFTWDNDLDNDTDRFLELNDDSNFFSGMDGSDLENKIRPFLHRYADFDFKILPKNEKNKRTKVSFIRINKITTNMETDDTLENFKISRGEETVFIWCFFLAIAQMAIDGNELYNWVKYLYIDDPVSSLDDNHAIAIGAHLAHIIKREDNHIKTIISTHHGLFFNVMFNELKSADSFFMNKLSDNKGYSLINTRDTPFFHHIILAQTLDNAVKTQKLYTYHFNILRNLMEKAAAFHGYSKFGECIKVDNNDDNVIYERMIEIMNHGNYSIFEPTEMQEENKIYFSKMVRKFLSTYHFNKNLFKELEKGENNDNKQAK